MPAWEFSAYDIQESHMLQPDIYIFCIQKKKII